MSTILPLERCNYCSRELPRFRVVNIHRAQNICDDCEAWHVEAISKIGCRGCQECNRDWGLIQRDLPPEARGNRIVCVPKDGIYQLLCHECGQKYLRKIAGMFKGTQYGKEVLNAF